MNKTPRILTLLLALVGLGVSLYLTWTHHRIFSDPTYESFCSINETFDCDRVNSSAYSELWGIPVALFGVGFYVAVAALSLMAMNEGRARRVMAVVWGLSAMAVFLSVVLATLSATAIGAWCIMCISLYAVNAGLLATSWRSTGLRLGPLVTELDLELRRIFSSGPLWVAGALFLGVVWIGNASLERPTAAVAGGKAPAEGSKAANPANPAAEGDDGEAARPSSDPVADATLVALEMYRREPVITLPLTGKEPYKGNPNAALVLVEFADFECPHCARAADTLDQMAAIFGDRIKVIYKNFPLDQKCNPLMQHQLHEHACDASVAALCAHTQGRFWEYHHLLFQNQTRLSEDTFQDFARTVGLDLGAWDTCRTGSEVAQALAADISAAQAVKLEGTPALFINGRMMKGPAIIRTDLLEGILNELLATGGQ